MKGDISDKNSIVVMIAFESKNIEIMTQRNQQEPRLNISLL